MQIKSSPYAFVTKNHFTVKTLSFPFVFRDLTHKKHTISFRFAFDKFIFMENK
jgi:hypothetical protein